MIQLVIIINQLNLVRLKVMTCMQFWTMAINIIYGSQYEKTIQQINYGWEMEVLQKFNQECKFRKSDFQNLHSPGNYSVKRLWKRNEGAAKQYIQACISHYPTEWFNENLWNKGEISKWLREKYQNGSYYFRVSSNILSSTNVI